MTISLIDLFFIIQFIQKTQQKTKQKSNTV